MLSDSQIERYSRQIILPRVGGQGQERLLRARVLVGGDGPSQTEALLYLAAAGVGRIGIYGTGRSPIWAVLSAKSQGSAAGALSQLNPDCMVIVHDCETSSDPEDGARLVEQYDVVLAEPNVRLHAACYVARRPFVCGQVSTTMAWLAVYRGYEENRPCLSCEPLPFSGTSASSDADGLGAPFVGTVLATEATKLVLGLNLEGSAKLLQYRFPELSFHERALVKNPHCPVCGRSE